MRKSCKLPENIEKAEALKNVLSDEQLHLIGESLSRRLISMPSKDKANQLITDSYNREILDVLTIIDSATGTNYVKRFLG